jgi:hypothetical protein
VMNIHSRRHLRHGHGDRRAMLTQRGSTSEVRIRTGIRP